jgi:hypothetical protein
MHHNHETVNDLAAMCVDTANQLRRYLFSGQAIPWTVRRDVATTANLLVDLSFQLEQDQQSDDDSAALLDSTTHMAGSVA